MKLYIFAICAAFFLVSCKKKIEQGEISLRLTDSPGQYEHVYIDIQGLEVRNTDGEWTTLQLRRTGVYDILNFDNGIDTILSTHKFSPCTINQIRLLLGSNNSVVKSGQAYTLIVPSAIQTGIKINVDIAIGSKSYNTFLLDFNAGKSIKELPNSVFKLNPVIKLIDNSKNGKIQGFVFPSAALAHVEAIQNGDTTIAIPESNGFYKIQGLKGMYKFNFISNNGFYTNFTIDSVSVDYNQLITLPNVNL